MKRPFAFALLLTALLSFNLPADAQLKKPGFLLGVNLFYATPQGDFNDFYRHGFGGEVNGGLGWGKTYLQATLGLARFSSRQGTGLGNIAYKPVKVGIKQYFFLRKVFVNADLGVGVVTNEKTDHSSARFIRGIGGGLHLFGLEGSIYYDGWKNEDADGFSNSVLFKLGYNFTL